MKKLGGLMLNNTAYKLKNDKKLRVAYFGGSITEGAGASDPTKTCYRAMTTAWFKAKYPDALVVAYVNTTVGVKALTDICCTSSNALQVFSFA